MSFFKSFRLDPILSWSKFSTNPLFLEVDELAMVWKFSDLPIIDWLKILRLTRPIRSAYTPINCGVYLIHQFNKINLRHGSDGGLGLGLGLG